MTIESVGIYKNSRFIIFVLSIICVLLCIGFGLRYLFPTVDDASFVSFETMKTLFSERTQLVHAYWINNGRKNTEFLDINNWNNERVRIVYKMSNSGWPVDSHYVGNNSVNYGKNPCVRLWESIIQERSNEVIRKMSSSTTSYEKGCVYTVNDYRIVYKFIDGSLKIEDLNSARETTNIYFN